MVFFAFFLTFLAQLVYGFPFMPLAMFWLIIKPERTSHYIQGEDFLYALLWAAPTGASLGVFLGNVIQWVTAMAVGALLVVFVRNYIFLALTPATISLLLLIMVASFLITIPSITLTYALTLYFIYLLLFFIVYALVDPQKNHNTRRLF